MVLSPTCLNFQSQKSLGLFRSDYMIHSLESNCIKQVEFNTIASSGGSFSSLSRDLHRYLANLFLLSIIHKFQVNQDVKEEIRNFFPQQLCVIGIELH